MNDFGKKRLKYFLINPENHQKIKDGINTALKKFAEIGSGGTKQ